MSDSEKVFSRMNINGKPWRESFDVPGTAHGANPIPTATRVGKLLVSSGIRGGDPSTGKLPADAARQVQFAFQHMDSLLAAAGASLADVARVTVFLKDLRLREQVNAEWLRRFPDPCSRPSRHTLVEDLRGDMQIQLEIMAVLP